MAFNADCHLELHPNRRCTLGQPCVHTVKVAALEEAIEKLEAMCKAERNVALERAYWHNAVHDPLNGIPPEIASTILCYANTLPKEHFYGGNNPLCYLNCDVKVPTRPLALASVCRQWRALAFSEPRLWTNIVMQRASSHWTLSQDLVNQWIGRSGQLPLVIVLAWDPTEEPVDNEIIALVKVVCALSHRWRRLVVRVPSEILPFFRCDAPHLLDLEHFTFISTDDYGVGTLVLGQTTIRPVILTLAGVWTPPANILWTNITCLNMYRVVPGAILATLSECTCLDEIYLSFISNMTGNVYPEPPAVVNLPSLTRMTIQDLQEEHVATFFVHIRAPALRVLNLSSSEDDTEAEAFSLASLQRLLMESEGSLLGLDLKGIPLFHEDFITLLEPLVHLCTLSLSYGGTGAHALSEQLLTRLSTSVTFHNGARFLPELSMLRYIGPRTFSWSSVALFTEAHNDCHDFMRIGPSNMRPFTSFIIDIEPQTLPDDLIDKEVLLHFMKLPPSWMRTTVKGGLVEASFQRHGLHQPMFDCRFPSQPELENH